MIPKTDTTIPGPGAATPRELTRSQRRERYLRRGLPALTVIVVADWTGDRCFGPLSELAEECRRNEVELIVVCSRPCPEIPLGALERVGRRIVAPSGATGAELRVLGMSAASGDIVAIVGDPADLEPGWVDRLRSRGRTSAADTPPEGAER